MTATPSLWRGQGGRLFLLLFGLNLLNYIDRAAVTGLLEPIRKELGGTDAQMGLVGSAFLLTYTMLPPLFGWLGDRMSRTRLLAGSAAAWCAATAAVGLVGSVGQLAAMRGVVGLGEASYMANTPSLLSDVFPGPRRGKVLSYFYSAAPIGAALGVAVAGYLAGHFGWRAACYIVGLPGLLAAFLLYRSREPVRGAIEGGVTAPPPPLLATVKALWTQPWFVVLTLGLASSVFVQNAIEYWMPTIIQRDKAIPIAEANASYGLMVFIAGVVGPVLGAAIGDWLARRTARGYLYVSALATVGTALPLAVIVLSAAKPVIFGGVLLEALAGNAATGLVMAVAMSRVGAETRGTTTAVLLTSMHLLGDFISWPLVGKMSTVMTEGGLTSLVAVARAAGMEAGHTLSIALAALAIPVAVAGGLFYFTAALLPAPAVAKEAA